MADLLTAEGAPFLNRPAIDPSEGYSPLVSYVFTINFIVGAGVLSLPYAFAKAGIVLGGVFLIFIAMLAVISMSWLVEVQGRATGLYGFMGEVQNIDRPPAFEITNLKFEVSQLVELFIGPGGRRFYEGCLFLFTWGALWVYTVVFASSMVNAVPIVGLTDDQKCDLYDDDIEFTDDCDQGYIIYIIIFAFLMGILATQDMSGQVVVQMTLTAFALLSILVMIFTVLGSMLSNPYIEDEFPYTGPESETAAEDSSAPYTADYDWVNFSGMAEIFSTAVFSQLAHHGAPGITRLCKDKRKVRGAFVKALSTTCTLYIILCSITTVYFGKDGVKAVITLNWSDYTGASSSAPWWALGIKYMVVLFPCITVSCAFPLYVVTMGNTMFELLPENLRYYSTPFRVKYACRLATMLPPMIGAMFLKDPAVLVSFTGLPGFAIMFIIPAMLQYYSVSQMEQRYGPGASRTPYSTHFSSFFYVYAIGTFAVLALLTTLVLTVEGLVN